DAELVAEVDDAGVQDAPVEHLGAPAEGERARAADEPAPELPSAGLVEADEVDAGQAAAEVGLAGGDDNDALADQRGGAEAGALELIVAVGDDLLPAGVAGVGVEDAQAHLALAPAVLGGAGDGGDGAAA